MSRVPRPCSRCPLWKDGYCSHLATLRPPDSPSCPHGRRKMNSQYCVEYNRKKFGWNPRRPKPEPEVDDAEP